MSVHHTLGAQRNNPVKRERRVEAAFCRLGGKSSSWTGWPCKGEAWCPEPNEKHTEGKSRSSGRVTLFFTAIFLRGIERLSREFKIISDGYAIYDKLTFVTAIRRHEANERLINRTVNGSKSTGVYTRRTKARVERRKILI